MSLKITLAETETQLKEIEDLAYAIWRQHYTPIIGPDQVAYMLKKYQSFNAMEQQISQQGYQYYGIWMDKELVGYFAVQPQSSLMFLSKLYLSSKWRGLGLSKRALIYIESLTQNLQLNVIQLTVNKYNTNSIQAYQAMGFSVVKEAVFDIGEGYVMDDYVMEKHL